MAAHKVMRKSRPISPLLNTRFHWLSWTHELLHGDVSNWQKAVVALCFGVDASTELAERLIITLLLWRCMTPTMQVSTPHSAH